MSYVENNKVIWGDFTDDHKLIVRTHYDIEAYCRDNHIQLSDFNIPVHIPDDVICCSDMFRDCISFNQAVVIPDSVLCCTNMFRNCHAFNQPIGIPDSVVDCSYMFIWYVVLICVHAQVCIYSFVYSCMFTCVLYVHMCTCSCVC